VGYYNNLSAGTCRLEKLMPPNLDIYGLTKHRDIETINRFLDKYVDRATIEERGDEELMMRPLDISNDCGTLESADWEPALTLTHSIHRGLDYPRRSFSIYLAAPQGSEMSSVLHFTEDDQLVLGLSIDDAESLPENEERAKLLLADLARDFECHLGLIAGEEPPPSSEVKFRAIVDEPFHALVFYRDFTQDPV
jgi:hypothetical protein